MLRHISKDVRSAISNEDLEIVMKLLEESPMPEAQIVGEYDEKVLNNGNVFHTSGVKLTWGDIGIKDVDNWAELSKKHNTTIYMLREVEGYSAVPDSAIIVLKPAPSDDPFSHSRYRNVLPPEATLLKPEYLERNAVLKLDKGIVSWSNAFITQVVNWSEKEWNDRKALILKRRP